MDFKLLISEFKNCECGMNHECKIDDIRIGRGLKDQVGGILKTNRFPQDILLIADKDTLKASEGILDSLNGFNITFKVYDKLRVATMTGVKEIEDLIDGKNIGVLAVGSGSVHDTARLACANKNVPLCLFATAPSMDGFASYSAPIVNDGFKITYPAKCPEIIIGDTEILAKAPNLLKSAGFGDMVSKYIAIIDWKVSHLITGESYCDKVCELTRYAIDNLMKLADKVTLNDPDTAGAIFESLILTGIAMSFTKTSRPGSGTEHILAHFWECVELTENKVPNFHGIDVGVPTLIIRKYYAELAKLKSVKAHAEIVDWEKVKEVYGVLYPDVEKLNTPDTITDGIDPKLIEEKWGEIVEIINSVPSYEECLTAMKKAGCPTTPAEIGKSEEFVKIGFLYHPFMRRRLSLKRLSHMLDL